MIRDRSKYRTPDEVFYDPAVRMAIRVPDASFALLFFDVLKGGRVVGPNGVRHEGRIYRLASLQTHLEYFGERVAVRANPDDQRELLVFDRRSGAFVCKAHADEQDATYDTRDEITRRLISRVFSDGKKLLRMARAQVEGADERLAEYRRAKIEYLVRRGREIAAAREAAKRRLAESAPVAVIGPFSSVAGEVEAAAQPFELTPEVIDEVLREDEPLQATASMEPSACRVAPRNPNRNKRTTPGPRALSYTKIAAHLGVCIVSLFKYRRGETAWPEGMREQFEALEGLRSASPETISAALAALPARSRKSRRGEHSYKAIAAALGRSLNSLLLYRSGKVPWPDGLKERFEELERRRDESVGARTR